VDSCAEGTGAAWGVAKVGRDAAVARTAAAHTRSSLKTMMFFLLGIRLGPSVVDRDGPERTF
jgi:hypothetical protein